MVLGSPCSPDAGGCDLAPALPGLVCDPDTHTCQMPCTTAADCTDADLGGFVCDRTHPLSDGTAICRDPTCPD